MKHKRFINIVLFSVLCSLFSVFYNCVSMAASAEEYYSIGMAYFELGRFEEAERWLNRARASDRTMVASQYNLGRIAFERGRFHEAARHFEDILGRDPNNVLALKAAAYTRINTGDISIAERHYSRLLELVPESADDGYNHALVLYAMGRYSDAEQVLERYLISLLENNEMQLLYARTQNAQNKAEAIDSFSNWLINNTDARVRHEYAQVLEHHELYARALEEFRKTLSEISAASTDPRRNEVRFAIARVLLIADGSSNEGITELQAAISEGFNNIAAVERLTASVIASNSVSAANRETLRGIISNMQNPTN
jgi:tetratricopeptide (TPR) repeat protein